MQQIISGANVPRSALPGFANAQLAFDAADETLMQHAFLRRQALDADAHQLLDQALNRQFHDAPDRVAPCLCSLLLEARDQAWQAWRQQADGLLTAAGRDALQRLPLEPAAG